MIRFDNALLHEEIYLIKDSTKVVKSTQKDSTELTETVLLPEIWLVYTPLTAQLPASTRDMLDKLCAAIQVPRLQVKSVIWNDSLHLFLAGLHKEAPVYAVVHHPDSAACLRVPELQHIQLGESTLMAAPSLETLEKDIKLKKSYWTALCKMIQ